MRPELQEALRLHRAGLTAQAEQGYLRILAADPADPIATHYLGLVRLKQAKITEALELLRRSITFSPSQPDFHLNLGIALLDAAQPQQAIPSLERAISLKPSLTRAHLNLGKALVLTSQPSRATDHLLRLVDQPQYRGSAFFLLSLAYEAMGNAAEAERFAASSVLDSPGAIDYRLNLARLLERKKSNAAALAEYDEALAIAMANGGLLAKRASVLQRISRSSEALSTVDQAISLGPVSAEMLTLRAQVLLTTGRFADAADSFNSALAQNPADIITETNAATTCLLAGDFEHGWELFEKRFRWKQWIAEDAGLRSTATRALPAEIPRWSGPTHVVDTLLILGEQGLGDEIMFGTVLADAARHCRRMMLEVDQRLIGLFSRAFPTATIVTRGAPLDMRGCDAALLAGSLPYFFRRSKKDFSGGNAGYLQADPTRVAALRQKFRPKGKLVCGISWTTLNPASTNLRTIPTDLFAHTLEGTDACFVNLQYGASSADQTTLSTVLGESLLDTSQINLVDDLEGVAALIECCDVIVTIGNSTAHLAASMGKPTVVLVPFVPGWRWSSQDQRTPWYASARVVRQEFSEDWLKCLAVVRSLLIRMSADSVTDYSGRFEKAFQSSIDADLDTLPFVENVLKPFRDLLRGGEPSQAQLWLETQLARSPTDLDLLKTKAFCAFRDQNFEAGLQLMKRARDIEDSKAVGAKNKALPIWDGTPSAGTLAVLLEPNLGEEILVSGGLVDLVKARQKALVEVDGRLLKVMRRSFPELEFIARGSSLFGARRTQLGVTQQASSLDLMKVHAAAIAGHHRTSYLQADPELVSMIRKEYGQRFPGKLLFGLSWRSARTFDGIDQKSFSLAAFRDFLRDPRVSFIDVQYGEIAHEVELALAEGDPLPWRDPDVFPTHDLERLAAQLCALDGLITVSNSTAHLAGALGVKTAVLLRKNPPLMWHWGSQGSRIPWYDSVSIHRDLDVHDGSLSATLERLIASPSW